MYKKFWGSNFAGPDNYDVGRLERIDVVPGGHILVGNTTIDFSPETIRLLKRETLRQKLTNSAYRLSCEKYDWTAVVPQLSDLLEQITHEND